MESQQRYGETFISLWSLGIREPHDCKHISIFKQSLYCVFVDPFHPASCILVVKSLQHHHPQLRAQVSFYLGNCPKVLKPLLLDSPNGMKICIPETIPESSTVYLHIVHFKPSVPDDYTVNTVTLTFNEVPHSFETVSDPPGFVVVTKSDVRLCTDFKGWNFRTLTLGANNSIFWPISRVVGSFKSIVCCKRIHKYLVILSSDSVYVFAGPYDSGFTIILGRQSCDENSRIFQGPNQESCVIAGSNELIFVDIRNRASHDIALLPPGCGLIDLACSSSSNGIYALCSDGKSGFVCFAWNGTSWSLIPWVSDADKHWVSSMRSTLANSDSAIEITRLIGSNRVLSFDIVWSAMHTIAWRREEELPKSSALSPIDIVSEYLQSFHLWEELAIEALRIFQLRQRNLFSFASINSIDSVMFFKQGGVAVLRPMDWSEFILMDEIPNDFRTLGEFWHFYSSCKKSASQLVEDFTSICTSESHHPRFVRRIESIVSQLVTLEEGDSGSKSVRLSDIDIEDTVLKTAALCDFSNDTSEGRPPHVKFGLAQEYREVLVARFEVIKAVLLGFLDWEIRRTGSTDAAIQRIGRISWKSMKYVLLELLQTLSCASYICNRSDGAILSNLIQKSIESPALSDIFVSFKFSEEDMDRALRILDAALDLSDYVAVMDLCGRFSSSQDPRLEHFKGISWASLGQVSKSFICFQKMASYFEFIHDEDFIDKYIGHEDGPFPNLEMQYCLFVVNLYESLSRPDFALKFATRYLKEENEILRRKLIELSLDLGRFDTAFNYLNTSKLSKEIIIEELERFVEATTKDSQAARLSSYQWGPLQSLIEEILNSKCRGFTQNCLNFENVCFKYINLIGIAAACMLGYVFHARMFGSDLKLEVNGLAMAQNCLNLCDSTWVKTFDVLAQKIVVFSSEDLNRIFLFRKALLKHELDLMHERVDEVCFRLIDLKDYKLFSDLVVAFEKSLNVEQILLQFILGISRSITDMVKLTSLLERLDGNYWRRSLEACFERGIYPGHLVNRIENCHPRPCSMIEILDVLLRRNEMSLAASMGLRYLQSSIHSEKVSLHMVRRLLVSVDEAIACEQNNMQKQSLQSLHQEIGELFLSLDWNRAAS